MSTFNCCITIFRYLWNLSQDIFSTAVDKCGIVPITTARRIRNEVLKVINYSILILNPIMPRASEPNNPVEIDESLFIKRKVRLIQYPYGMQ